MIFYMPIGLHYTGQNLEKPGLTEAETGCHWVTLLGLHQQSQSGLHSAGWKSTADQATLPDQTSASSV